MGNLSRVDYREFRSLRDGCTTNLPPPSDAVLASAARDLGDRLRSSAMFTAVTVETTGDADRLLVAEVHYRPGARVEQVSSHLEAVWVAVLRLPGLDAFNFHTRDKHVELEAVTGDKASGHFLTLHLLAVEGTPEEFEAPEPSEDRPRKRRWFQR